jgi:Tfp pilus assembly protein PilF
MDMKNAVALTLFLTSAIAFTTTAEQAQTPMSEEEVLMVLKKFKKDQMKAVAIVGERSVSFDVTPEFTKKLQKAGADRSFFDAVVEASPSGRSFSTPLGERIQVTPSEKVAFIAIQNELDPDRQLGMIEDFQQKFPNSPLMSYLYTQSAKSYQQKGDYEKAVDYCERSIKLDPNNIFSLSMVALILAQPKMLQGTAAEIEKRLSNAESYAKRALQLTDQISAQALAKDPELQKRKASLTSDAHLALGMVYLNHDDYAKAADEFKASISLAIAPSPMSYFRLGEAYESDGKLDLAVDAFRKASDLGQGTVFKTYADKKLEELKARK